MADWVILALAVYGLAAAITQMTRLIRPWARAGEFASVTFIVLIRNQADLIEGVVRQLISHCATHEGSAVNTDLILVDLASTDDTRPILNRLQQRYPHVKLIELPAEHAESACDTAMFLARGPIAVVLDLRYGVKEDALNNSLNVIWK